MSPMPAVYHTQQSWPTGPYYPPPMSYQRTALDAQARAYPTYPTSYECEG